jgi:hypothetical protein
MENRKAAGKPFNEASLDRVYAHTQGRNIGMITADRPEDGKEEFGRAYIELEKLIRTAGYGFIKIVVRHAQTHDAENPQASYEYAYLVVGKSGDDRGQLLSFLKKHGERYKLASILHATHGGQTNLHGTSERMWLGRGAAHDVGVFHPRRVGEFLALMKGAEDLSFESIRFISGKSFFTRQETDF